MSTPKHAQERWRSVRRAIETLDGRRVAAVECQTEDADDYGPAEAAIARLIAAAPEMAELLRRAITWEARLNQAEQALLQNDHSRWQTIKSEVATEHARCSALLATLAPAGGEGE